MRQGWIVATLLVLSFCSFAQTGVYAPSDIPLLDNRFRIDYNIDNITFIIARKPGSNPAILVQPDGSKIYAHRARKNVHWLALDDHDIITIEHPMPGPWQALGEINPDNRIRLVSGLALEADPVPVVLYRGERIKLTGRLLRQGKPITERYFLSDVGMSVRLMNFEEEDIKASGRFNQLLGQYKDDGKGYDEIPGDGIVTAYAVVDAPGGKYRLVISTASEVFTRAKHQEILLYPAPARMTIPPLKEDKAPYLSLTLDVDELDPTTVAFRGEVIDAKENVIERLDGTRASKASKFNIPFQRPDGYGRFDVRMTLYATTLGGREIVISLPDSHFYMIEPEPLVPEPAVVQTQTEKEDETSSGVSVPLWVVVIIMVFLLVVAGGLTLVLLKRRALKRILAAQKLAIAKEKKQQEEAKAPPPDAKAPPEESLESIDLNIPEQ